MGNNDRFVQKVAITLAEIMGLARPKGSIIVNNHC